MQIRDYDRQLPAGSTPSDTPTTDIDDPPESPNSPNSPVSVNNPSEVVPIFYVDDYLRAHSSGDLSQFTGAYNPFISDNSKSRPFPFQFPLPQIGLITMADRFPKIEDLDLGKFHLVLILCRLIF